MVPTSSVRSDGNERRTTGVGGNGAGHRLAALALVALMSLGSVLGLVAPQTGAVTPGIGPQDVAWVDQFGTQTFGHALTVGGDSVAVDAAGNVYVGGGMNLGAAFPGQVTAGGEDAYVRKYDSAGNIQWTRQFGGPGNEWLSGLYADAAGVFVAGTTWGAGLPGQPFAGAADAYVQVFDSGVNERWSRGFGTPAEDLANHVLADATGVYVTGTTWGTLPGQTTAGANDIFVRKYDPNGNELWTYQFGGGGSDYGQGLTQDASGVYVSGTTTGALSGETNKGGFFDGFVRKYTRDGVELWTRQPGTSAEDRGFRSAADGTNVYLVGWTRGAFPGYTNQGQVDPFVVAFRADGTELWTRQFGTAGWDFLEKAAADATGVYIGGSSGGVWPGQPNPDSDNIIVRKYDASGTELWTLQIGTAAWEGGGFLATAPDRLYVVGRTDGSLPGFTNAGATESFLQAFDVGAAVQWTRQYGVTGWKGYTDAATAVAVDHDIYVAGYAEGPFPGEQNLGGSDAFVRRSTPDGDVVWLREFGTTAADQATAIAAAPSGVYLAGWTDGVFAGSSSVGGRDAFVRAYDEGGNERWTRQFGTAASDTATGIAAGGSAVYVVGVTSGVLPGQAAAGGQDAFVRAYDFDGNELWTQQFGTSATDQATSIVPYASGAFVAGQTAGVLAGQPGTGSSSPSLLTVVGSMFFFSANDGVVGAELWRSDGTAAGTVLVKDINPGPASSSPSSLIAVGSSLFFTANDGMNGVELWRSDGTAAGTMLAKDIQPGSSGSTPSALTRVGSTLFFAANDGTTGTELWASDGSAVGTILLKDINPGSAASVPAALAAVGSTLFFAANDGATGIELWTSDGTAGGTRLVRDIRPGSLASSPSVLTAVGPGLFFVANDGVSGNELWRSDGTAAGTVLVRDLNPGSAASSPSNLAAVGFTLFFAANDGVSGNELWRSDGTAAGTVLVKDIWPGAGSSSPTFPKAVSGTLFFRANNGANGIELWKSDGTDPGTILLRDIFPGPSNSLPTAMTAVGSILFFQANDGTTFGAELWRSDGTPGGTVLVKDIGPGLFNSFPGSPVAVGPTLFFAANDGATGSELWRSDGTPAGTALVKNINMAAGSTDIFLRRYDASGNVLWTVQFGSSAGEIPFLAADTTAVYVSGSTGGVLPGQMSAGNADAFVRRYDPDGNEVWTRQFGTPSFEILQGAVAFDATPGYEGVYVVGTTEGTFPGQVSSGGRDAYVVMFDRSGNRVWTRQFGSTSTDSALGVGTTFADVYVVGFVNGPLPGETSLGGQDAFLVKLALPPLQKIQLVMGEIARLVDDGTLNRGQGNSLTAKLEAAAAQLEKGNQIPAANMLRAFANEVAAMGASRRLPASEATLLIEWAGNIIDQIDG